MAERCQIEINSQNKPQTLQIDLKKLSTVASTVLSGAIKYKIIEVRGKLNEDIDNSKDLDLYRHFWRRIGSTTTELILSSGESYWYETPEFLSRHAKRVESIVNAFVGLKKLKLRNPSDLYLLSPEFYKRNKEIEVIEINSDRFIDRDTCSTLCIFESTKESEDFGVPREFVKGEGQNWELLPQFKNIFNRSESLKKISFPCRLRFSTASKNAIAYFTTKYLSVDEVIVESDTLSANSHCYITKIEIEIFKNNQLTGEVFTKAIVKFIDIAIFVVSESHNLGGRERFCVFEHNIFMSKTVELVTVSSDITDLCTECLEFMIKSFPNVKSFVDDGIGLYSTTVMFLSKYMPCLTELSLSYHEGVSENLQLWEVFQQLKSLQIVFDSNQSSPGLVRFCRLCPNVKELKMKFRFKHRSGNYVSISEETIVEGITKYMPNIEILELEHHLKVGSRSLNKICASLKQLTKLTFGYEENPRDLLQLFKDLPQLRFIKYNSIKSLKCLTRQDYQSIQEPEVLDLALSKEYHDSIEILPEEIWAAILRNLSLRDQVNCRRVCKRWWHIMSTYPHFDRELTLGYCTLTVDKNPVKIFQNTQFNYNRLSLQGLAFCHGNDLNDFWRHLGGTIRQINIDVNPSQWSEYVNSGMTMGNLIALKAIEFANCDTFFRMVSIKDATMSGILKVITRLTLNYWKYCDLYMDACPEMPNLEYIKVDTRNWFELCKFFLYINGHCQNLRSLDIKIDYTDHPTRTETQLLRRLEHIKFHGKALNIEMIDYFLNDSPVLKALTIHEIQDKFKDKNIRKIAIGLFKRISNLTDLLFLSSKNKIKYTLSESKNIVEYTFSNDHILTEIIDTMVAVAVVAPTNSKKRFKSN